MVDQTVDGEDKKPLMHSGGGHTVIHGPDVSRLLFNNKPARRVEHFSLPVDAVEPEGSTAAPGSGQGTR